MNGAGCTIYDWRGGPDFLLFRTLPGSVCVRAKIGDAGTQVLQHVGRDCKFFFFHLNITFTAGFVQDRDHLVHQLADRGIRCYNSATVDVSKRFLHDTCRRLGFRSTLATRDGDPDEFLIVKTNLNCGGNGEFFVQPAELAVLGIGPPSASVLNIRSEYFAQGRSVTEMYPVLPRSAVPVEWWNEPQIVIEQFVENERRRFLRIHFLLDNVTLTDAVCHAPVKKLPYAESQSNHYFMGGVHVGGPEVADDLPADLLFSARRLQSAMGMDFGAFDIVMDDASNCYFIDANHTPFGGKRESHLIYDHLRMALEPI